MGIPEEEEHKIIINNNIVIINRLLYISIFILLIILTLKDTSFFDKLFIYLLLFVQGLTLFVCNIKWNQKIMLYVHYLYCIIIYCSIFSNNIYILIYFILVVIANIYVWYINNDSCIFGGLDWGNEKLENWGNYFFRLFPIFYSLKIAYIKNNNKATSGLSNIIETTVETLKDKKVLDNIPEKIDNSISFDELHNILVKNIDKIKLIENTGTIE